MKKEKTLSEKTHQFEDLEEWVYLKDVKQFIKEILNEVEATKENIVEGVNNYDYNGIAVRNNFNILKKIIKQKSGFGNLK